jgi:putative transcriptional regulator
VLRGSQPKKLLLYPMANPRKNSENHRSKRDDSVENEILAALNSFTDALEKGEVSQRFTCRQIRLNLESSAYSPNLVRQTRRKLGLSQALFARFLGVSVKTVRAWEQGINTPQPMACRFMDEIRQAPGYWLQRLKESVG